MATTVWNDPPRTIRWTTNERPVPSDGMHQRYEVVGATVMLHEIGGVLVTGSGRDRDSAALAALRALVGAP